ncbi:MAG: leucine-rich repeat domain-containing protein, partial [Actinobacteria bacterium]|nr:leucine-rich repeat domain-containing protein [Actinomycetota bacterium]
TNITTLTNANKDVVKTLADKLTGTTTNTTNTTTTTTTTTTSSVNTGGGN